MKKSESYEDYLIKELKDSQEAADYFDGALEGGDIESFLLALQRIIKAQGGIAKIAEKAQNS